MFQCPGTQGHTVRVSPPQKIWVHLSISRDISYLVPDPYILEASHTERKLAVESSLSIENTRKSWLRAPMFEARFGIYVINCI